jgi:nitrogen PTS system EIIA component
VFSSSLAAMPREDFTTESLARYLHLSPQQVGRLADRGKLPGRKVAGQWRFSREEIHHWLEQRVGLTEDDGLPEVEGVLRRTGQGLGEKEISIAELLAPESIAVPLAARTRNSVFSSMVELAAKTGLLWDPEEMDAAIRAREDLYPTTLGNGVALLHPRRPMPNILAQPLLALGISPGGLPFGGNRGALTDVFFLICSTDDRGHLRTLARLSRILSSPGFLEALRQTPDALGTHALIRETEAQLADI